MERDQWLRELKERADETVCKDVTFTPGMEEAVRKRIRQRSQRQRRGPLLASASAAVTLLALWMWWPDALQPKQPTAPGPAPETTVPPLFGLVSSPPVLWNPSPQTETVHDGKPFRYVGEKPVRIITDELYEGQMQNVFWLLNGPFAPEVNLVGWSTEGERVELGSYRVAGPQYDADGHFPSGIVLPHAGIWKLQVVSGGKHFGQVFVEVKEGVSPANRELVTPLITRYLQSVRGDLDWLGGERDVKLDVIGVEAPNAESRRVYAWVQITGRGGDHQQPALSAPMVFDIAYRVSRGGSAGYQVTSHRMPEDGSRYQSSLESMFPPQIVQKLKRYGSAH
ncbi:hypothetical protein A6764_15635 [Brevibacillus sp. WF146]|uniref:hypothetical protein n=1 Tax=Brevibacillus sp. WF146 TaxID=319501 RepID=UPI0007ECF0DA|nr:hypothetical protein [Brevibacillus sp. WF146]UYZ12245.1 hypothetical protein A6764_15635 [Brevibacillus sp. WF146]